MSEKKSKILLFIAIRVLLFFFLKKGRKELEGEYPRKITYDGKYKLGYWGDHAWDAIKVAGDWYYVDTTADRRN